MEGTSSPPASSTDTEFFHKDEAGTVQGPFDEEAMQILYVKGKFCAETAIKIVRNGSTARTTMGHLRQKGHINLPFLELEDDTEFECFQMIDQASRAVGPIRNVVQGAEGRVGSLFAKAGKLSIAADEAVLSIRTMKEEEKIGKEKKEEDEKEVKKPDLDQKKEKAAEEKRAAKEFWNSGHDRQLDPGPEARAVASRPSSLTPERALVEPAQVKAPVLTDSSVPEDPEGPEASVHRLLPLELPLPKASRALTDLDLNSVPLMEATRSGGGGTNKDDVRRAFDKCRQILRQMTRHDTGSLHRLGGTYTSWKKFEQCPSCANATNLWPSGAPNIIKFTTHIFGAAHTDQLRLKNLRPTVADYEFWSDLMTIFMRGDDRMPKKKEPKMNAVKKIPDNVEKPKEKKVEKAAEKEEENADETAPISKLDPAEEFKILNVEFVTADQSSEYRSIVETALMEAVKNVKLPGTSISSHRSALIVAPTKQFVAEAFHFIGRNQEIFQDLKIINASGGTSVRDNIRDITWKSDIVIGTTGRLLDLTARKVLKCTSFTLCVIADLPQFYLTIKTNDVQLPTVLGNLALTTRMLTVNHSAQSKIALAMPSFTDKSLKAVLSVERPRGSMHKTLQSFNQDQAVDGTLAQLVAWRRNHEQPAIVYTTNKTSSNAVAKAFKDADPPIAAVIVEGVETFGDCTTLISGSSLYPTEEHAVAHFNVQTGDAYFARVSSPLAKDSVRFLNMTSSVEKSRNAFLNDAIRKHYAKDFAPLYEAQSGDSEYSTRRLHSNRRRQPQPFASSFGSVVAQGFAEEEYSYEDLMALHDTSGAYESENAVTTLCRAMRQAPYGVELSAFDEVWMYSQPQRSRSTPDVASCSLCGREECICGQRPSTPQLPPPRAAPQINRVPPKKKEEPKNSCNLM